MHLLASVIVALLLAAVAVLIPGFIGLAKCGSFGAAYTGCLMGTQCACNVTDAKGKSKCVKTTKAGCDSLGTASKGSSVWAGQDKTCTMTECNVTGP